MEPYKTKSEKQREKRKKQRMAALEKLANGKPVQCAICGCPHAEIMHIGHPQPRYGHYHRKMEGKMVRWILRTPIEEVLKYVQLECPYCNSWHNKFKEYPPPEKRPQWGFSHDFWR